MARPARKQREIDETRHAILAAAARVFAAQGFDAATMKEIAAEAQYSAPSLYSYFDGKQAILDALAEQLVDDVPGMFTLPSDLERSRRADAEGERLDLALQHVRELGDARVLLELPSGLALPQKVELLMRNQNEWMARHRDFLVFASRHVSPAPRITKRIKGENMDVEGQLVAQLADWLRKNATPMELGGRDPVLLAMLLMGITHSLFNKWIRKRGKGSMNEDLAAALDVFFHGV